jgi:hypothetical protein
MNSFESKNHHLDLLMMLQCLLWHPRTRLRFSLRRRPHIVGGPQLPPKCYRTMSIRTNGVRLCLVKMTPAPCIPLILCVRRRHARTLTCNTQGFGTRQNLVVRALGWNPVCMLGKRPTPVDGAQGLIHPCSLIPQWAFRITPACQVLPIHIMGNATPGMRRLVRILEDMVPMSLHFSNVRLMRT